MPKNLKDQKFTKKDDKLQKLKKESNSKSITIRGLKHNIEYIKENNNQLQQHIDLLDATREKSEVVQNELQLIISGLRKEIGIQSEMKKKLNIQQGKIEVFERILYKKDVRQIFTDNLLTRD